MNYKKVSDGDLLSEFGQLVRSERKITQQVLACIAEIDTRKIYLEKAYSSLFDFLTREYGYSAGAAMRRIDGARLLREIPEVSESLSTGKINLTQINQLQRAAREVRKLDSVPVTVATKKDLLARIENADHKETEAILAAALSLPVTHAYKETHHRDQSVSLTITFTSSQIKTFETARAMVGHATDGADWAGLFVYFAEREIRRRSALSKRSLYKLRLPDGPRNLMESKVKEGSSRGDKCKAEKDSNVEQDSKVEKNTNVHVNVVRSATAATAVKSFPSSEAVFQLPVRKNKPSFFSPMRKPLPAALRKSILHPKASCQYVDGATGRVCGARRYLQIDHVTSVSAGGSNSLDNLQVLCGAHNRYKFQMQG